MATPPAPERSLKSGRAPQLRLAATLAGLCALAAALSSFGIADLPLPGLRADAAAHADARELGALPLVVPTIRYGLEMERYGDFVETDVARSRTLSSELRAAGLPRALSRRLAAAAAAQRPAVRRLPPHRRTVVYDAAGEPAQVIIELDPLEFLRFDLAAETATFDDADGITREFETMTLFYGGDIDSALYAAALSPELEATIRSALTAEMPLAPEFRVGLIKLVYTSKRDDLGQTCGYGAVEALRYGVGEHERTAYRFADHDLDVEGFFHPDGTPAIRTWLTSPVASGYLSSPFNLRRRHPVLKTVRPHYGTDYAADYGEPVLALSDGIVVAKGTAANNGNFVKLEHDGTYATQYLHLKGFAFGLRPGQRVRKGDVLGYVGSTGLSSGPHVCLRFWKHGQQVDFQRELRRLPTTNSLGAEAMTAFEERQERLGELLEPRA